MLIKIIDNLITMLTKIRNKLTSKPVTSNGTEFKSVDKALAQPTLKKRGRPKLNKPSLAQQPNTKNPRKSKALPKVMKEKKAKRGTKRNPQTAVEKAKQVDKLIKGENVQ